MSDSNPKVNLAGSGVIPHVQTPDGEFVPQAGTADGALSVAVAGDMSGTGLALETTAQSINDATTALAGTITVVQPLASDPAVAVKIAASAILTVQVDGGQTATATPDASATGIVTRLAGVTTAPVGESGTGLETVAYQAGEWTVSLGPGDPGKPQFIQGVDGDGVPERLATEATSAASLVEQQGLRAQLPTALDGGRLVVETELDATGAIATEAKQDDAIAAITSLEVEVADDATTTDVQAVEAAVASLETEAALGAKEVTAQAIESAVDELETKLGTLAAQESTQEETRDRIARPTMTGAGRAAPYRSLSFVQHDPNQMLSLGGTVAYNPRCDFALVGAGALTYVPARRCVRLAVSGASGDAATYRQRIWNPAIPGSVQCAVFAVPFDAPRANQETRVGLFDDNNGVYLLQTNVGLFLAIRSSVSGSVVETTTALSGLNPALDNIVEIRYLWPAGGVEVWSNGTRLLVVSKAGGATSPWMRRPNLPFTSEIRNVGVSSAGFVDVIYFDVYSEGADRFNRTPSALTATIASLPTTGKLMLQARARQSFDLGTLLANLNRGVYLPRYIDVDTTNGPMYVRCYANGTTNGGEVWTPSTVEQGVETDTTAVFAGATGTLFAAGTIDTATGSCRITFDDPSIESFATSSGAYFGSEVLQIVGFARTGTVSSASVRIGLQRIW
jgi:hypothetical protein